MEVLRGEDEEEVEVVGEMEEEQQEEMEEVGEMEVEQQEEEEEEDCLEWGEKEKIQQRSLWSGEWSPTRIRFDTLTLD